MNNLFPFIISFFLPGTGQLILKDYKKGFIIFLSYVVLTYLLIFHNFLSFIPIWFAHIIFMIWALFDLYDTIEEHEGRKPANRRLAFSTLVVLVIFPLFLLLLTSGIFQGMRFFNTNYLNEDRTIEEMDEISLELEFYKNSHGVYPENYLLFVGRKPIWSSWKTDSWKKPYKYEQKDSVNYKLISAGKDGIYHNEDDIVRTN